MALADLGAPGNVVALAAACGTSPPLGFGFAELVKYVTTECNQSRSHEKLPKCRQRVDDGLLVGRKPREIEVNLLLRNIERVGLLLDKPGIHDRHRIPLPVIVSLRERIHPAH